MPRRYSNSASASGIIFFYPEVSCLSTRFVRSLKPELFILAGRAAGPQGHSIICAVQMVITHYCALGGFSRTGQRLHGAALRSGAPGTGQAERAGRERGTGENGVVSSFGPVDKIVPGASMWYNNRKEG